MEPLTRTEVNPKLGNASADGLDATDQSVIEALDACKHDTAYRLVGQFIHPGGEWACGLPSPGAGYGS